jgi:hypothetical protein
MPISAFFSIVVAAILATPVLIIWGWIRWSQTTIPRTIPSTLSFIGFCLATASALLGLFAALYARFIHRFPFYDPALMKIYACGSLLSLAAVLFAVGGVWRKGPVRWHAPACAIGTLLFWIAAMSHE